MGAVHLLVVVRMQITRWQFRTTSTTTRVTEHWTIWAEQQRNRLIAAGVRPIEEEDSDSKSQDKDKLFPSWYNGNHDPARRGQKKRQRYDGEIVVRIE